jgi:hypothetical protein
MTKDTKPISQEATMGMNDKQADVYGQIHPNETPDLVDEKLAAFEKVVANIPKAEKANLLEAEKRCPRLLTNNFKLMFLRCEVFDVDVSPSSQMNFQGRGDRRVLTMETCFKIQNPS